MCTCYPIINRVSELKVHIELTRFVQPEKIEIDANERAVNEKSQYCFFVCTTFDSFLNDLRNYSDVLHDVAVGAPVFLTKNGRGRYAILDMQDFEKTQATLRLMNELAKGRKSGEEKGWLTLEAVEKNLGIVNE